MPVPDTRTRKVVARHDIRDPEECGHMHVDNVLRIAAQPADHAGIPDKILAHLWGARGTRHPCDLAPLAKLRRDLGRHQPNPPPSVQRGLGDECRNPSHARRTADPVMH